MSTVTACWTDWKPHMGIFAHIYQTENAARDGRGESKIRAANFPAAAWYRQIAPHWNATN